MVVQKRSKMPFHDHKGSVLIFSRNPGSKKKESSGRFSVFALCFAADVRSSSHPGAPGSSVEHECIELNCSDVTSSIKAWGKRNKNSNWLEWQLQAIFLHSHNHRDDANGLSSTFYLWIYRVFAALWIFTACESRYHTEIRTFTVNVLTTVVLEWK